MKDIFKYEETLSKNNYILIIKMDNDLYLYMEPLVVIEQVFMKFQEDYSLINQENFLIQTVDTVDILWTLIV